MFLMNGKYFGGVKKIYEVNMAKHLLQKTHEMANNLEPTE